LGSPLVDPLQLELSNSAARLCRTSHLRGHAPIEDSSCPAGSVNKKAAIEQQWAQ